MHLAMRASALVVFPGGFGTLDELFELLTLRQTGKMPVIPITLVDRPFWTSIINFDELVKQNMITAHDLALFEFAERAEEIWATLENHPLPRGGDTVAEA
jgi:predicted Rossmann-fold nucleotide-binding protein